MNIVTKSVLSLVKLYKLSGNSSWTIDHPLQLRQKITWLHTGYSKQLIDGIISHIAYLRDREYLKNNFAFYSEDGVTRTWEILEGHVKATGDQEMSGAFSESDNSNTSDESEVDTISSTDDSSTSDSPVFRRRKQKITGIVFSDDASSSEGDSD